MPPHTRQNPRLLLAALLVVALILSLVFLPVASLAASFLSWVDALGVWAPIVFALAYIPASLIAFPGSILTLGAGALFGVPVGVVVVSLGSTLGASITFVVSRAIGRGAIEARIARYPRFASVERAVADDGFKVVLLTRLSPLFPFNLLNYAYGVSDIRFRDYVLASWIGMLPGSVLYVYLGSVASSTAELLAGEVPAGGVAQTVLLWGGLVATLVVTVLVTRIARRALDQVTLSVAEPGNSA